MIVKKQAVRETGAGSLPLFFRKQLLSYAPFLIFLTQLTQEFSPDDAASFTVAVLEIENSPAAALKTLRSWGVHADLIRSEHGMLVPTYEPVKLLDLGFLSRLSSAMEDAAKVRTFVVQELGPELVADMNRRGVKDLPIALADGLTRYESEPRRIGDPVGSLIESFCSSLFDTPVESNSLPDIATKLEQHGVILNSHRNLLVGLSGFRHPASHGPDKKTQRPWEITPRGALVGHLLALTTLRSIFLWTRADRQEI